MHKQRISNSCNTVLIADKCVTVSPNTQRSVTK